MQTLKYVWNADIEVSVEWRHWDISGMQTSGYQWNTAIGISVECRHWGISGIQTLEYQWNADAGECVRGPKSLVERKCRRA